MKNPIILLVFFISLAGCATSGNKFDHSGVSKLQPGQTTLDDATSYFRAQPYQVVRRDDGLIYASWVYTFATSSRAKVESIGLLFGADRVLMRLVNFQNVDVSDADLERLN